jgi:rubrerythrin
MQTTKDIEKNKYHNVKLPRNLTDRIGALRCRACGKELENSKDELCSVCWSYANEYFNDIEDL